MLTALKFHGCTVHLFSIDGRSYYVTRMDFFAALPVDSRRVAVATPLGMSYQQAAMKAARLICKYSQKARP